MFEGKAKNRQSPASPTYGATHEKLKANGYLAMAAPFAYVDFNFSPQLRQPPMNFVSELPVAVACAGLEVKLKYGSDRQRLHYILVNEPDAKWRAEIDAALESYKLARGPVRHGSDGSTLRPMRITDPTAAYTKAVLAGAVTVAGAQGQGFSGGGMQFEFIALDGVWAVGTLLDTKFSDLPSASVADLDALLRELARLKDLPPAPALPSRRGWLGERT